MLLCVHILHKNTHTQKNHNILKIAMKNNKYRQIKKMVQKAIDIIQQEAATFSQKTKTHYSGSDDDLVTSADIKAQAMYVEEIKKHFPNEGFIGEENGVNIQPKVGYGYFTVDPLDGTKAFGRTQSTGSATMIAHVDPEGFVDMVCIGDINTGEIYGFGPNQQPTRTRFDVETKMKVDTHIPLNKKYIVLRDHPEKYPPVINNIVKPGVGVFKDIEIASGSIGLLTARLWKNEIAVLAWQAGYDTPWDNTPIIGMNKALGIVHLRLDLMTQEVQIFDPTPPKDVAKRDWIEILAHKNYVDELIKWVETHK